MPGQFFLPHKFLENQPEIVSAVHASPRICVYVLLTLKAEDVAHFSSLCTIENYSRPVYNANSNTQTFQQIANT
ncbi:MAG: hypothetical protein HY965_04555 [Ignavibacteriales bacterium]|nr:hypothetical protein [Ignavibacteriales bacterium]